MKRSLRILLALVPLAALAGALTQFAGARSARDELVAGVHGLGPLTPELARRVKSEIDPAAARLVVARSVVSAYLDPERRLAAAAGATQESTLAALERARELSRATLKTRPTSWQAWMLVGATTYLIRLQERDTRLFSHARDWEAPLEHAHELAPGQIEPRRFLAAAYLDTWPALSHRKREITQRLLAELLDDRESFRLLVPAWLRVSGEGGAPGDVSFSLIPNRTWAWSYLLDELARSGQWHRYATARERWHAALADSLRESLREAGERLDGGDVEGARTLLTTALGQTPLGSQYAEIFAAALGQLPPGPISGVAERRVRQWYDWSLRLCTTVGCPLPPAILGRLAGAVRDELPHEAAVAALAAGNRSGAEAIERRNPVEREQIWSEYLIYKAAWMVQAGDLAAATAALDAVAPAARHTPRYLLAASRLAQLLGTPLPTDAVERARWDRGSWREGRDGLSLELVPGRAAAGLALSISALAAGGAVDVRWDGRRLGTYVAGSGGEIRLPLAVSPELHLLEIAPITGARPTAATARLLGSE